MEDKKTLWIIIGIGVCVIVVVAVGFFWFLPTDQSLASAEGNNATSQAGTAGFDPVEWVRQDDSFPGVQQSEEPTEDFVVVADDLVYGIPETVNSADSPAESSQEGGTITLDLPKAEAAKPAPSVDIKPAAPVRAAVVEKPSQPAVKQAVRMTEYWIQAGSFSSLSKAKDVKAELTENGAASTISTTNVNGTDYYRVRLGPYSDQMEADKFLSWVKAVDGFGNSYISEVYVTK